MPGLAVVAASHDDVGVTALQKVPHFYRAARVPRNLDFGQHQELPVGHNPPQLIGTEHAPYDRASFVAKELVRAVRSDDACGAARDLLSHRVVRTERGDELVLRNDPFFRVWGKAIMSFREDDADVRFATGAFRCSADCGCLGSRQRKPLMLVNGKWSADWQPVQATDAKGGFVRQTSSFRNWVTPDGAAGPDGRGRLRRRAGRYHLYAALTCPWASRTLIARKLKRLEDVVSVAIVEPGDDRRRAGVSATIPARTATRSMARPTCTKSIPAPTRISPAARPSPSCGTASARRSSTTNRPTSCACSIPASARSPRARSTSIPTALRAEIDALNDAVYPTLNNGVYRAGFATTQAAYEEAFRDVFAMLDELEARLATRPVSVRRAAHRDRHPRCS